eukprot:CAMPEP_0176026066 /NCGR_PEP_ID=MMETSP0120_2-20121206/12764_1 /TAXON_ID=160619 /ORGANISM="Kryptoperidinium foliaceum, Strain CCMP 1326" /LENGTH=89 /DNA_ID=CAMNT_0017359261 /DNA_START=65 /DNA_END=334 /DNA_ORIENTATION=+
MSAALAKLTNPATYRAAWTSTCLRAQAYYHPDVKQNGSKLLWHSMLGISIVMYTGTYISRVRPEVQHTREIKRVALEEYYEKHGGSPHH